MKKVRAYTLLAAAMAVVVGGFVLPGRAEAVSSPQVTSIDCAKHPALFDVIYITNGADAHNLAGWTLRSDPEGSEQMSLAPAGSLDPGEQLIVVAGAHGVTIPSENVYLWTNAEVLRDSGDPADYVKVFDPSGSFVGGMDCTGRVLTAAAPTPAPAPVPTQAAAAAQDPPTTQPTNQQAAVAAAKPAAAPKAVPNSGGATAEGSVSPTLFLGAAVMTIGAALVIMGLRRETVAARLTSTEGESRTDPRGVVRRRPGGDNGGRS